MYQSNKRKINTGVLIIILSLLAVNSAVFAQLSPRNANYTMNVKLDTETRIITGVMTLEWRNITQASTNELRFHMYFNGWRNNISSFYNAIRSNYELSNFKDDEWAFIDVSSMQLNASNGNNESDITTTLQYIQPDDSNPDDRTVLRAELPYHVQPGETITVDIAWQTKVPITFRRTGMLDDYYFLAHWFPKLGVFQEDGTWNCHQFIQTEFFSDYGVYDVKLTIPSEFVLGSTGKEMEVKDNGDGTSTHRYYQEDVHSFTWTASPDFTVHTQTFSEAGLPIVEMRLLLMPDHANKRDRYFAATAACLKYYGTWFGAYPYQQITIIDPAYQSKTGGMEYPTLFTGGTRLFSPPEMRSPESVTVHEAGHQFWYAIVGNNEFEDAWLDEGFNTYSTTRTMEAAFPNPVYTRRYFEGFIPVVYSGIPMVERTVGADGYFGHYSTLKRDAMSTQSYKQGPDAYGLNSYGKPGMMLRTLENFLGWDVFQRVMSTFFDRYKFKHPKPQDFFDVANEVSGQNLMWFFDQAFNSSKVFDYAVDRVTKRKLDSATGYVEKSGELKFQKDFTDGSNYLSEIYIQRWGDATFPIDVKFTFSDDTEVTESWDGIDRWHLFSFVRPGKIVKIEVDPKHVLTLDMNYSNNSWTADSEAGAASKKWAAKWMLWVQNVMEFFAFFG